MIHYFLNAKNENSSCQYKPQLYIIFFQHVHHDATNCLYIIFAFLYIHNIHLVMQKSVIMYGRYSMKLNLLYKKSIIRKTKQEG